MPVDLEFNSAMAQNAEHIAYTVYFAPKYLRCGHQPIGEFFIETHSPYSKLVMT